jgi:hypothetical protein
VRVVEVKKKLRIHTKAFLKTYMKGKQKKTFLQEQLLLHNSKCITTKRTCQNKTLMKEDFCSILIATICTLFEYPSNND